jgi:hypothetical protein
MKSPILSVIFLQLHVSYTRTNKLIVFLGQILFGTLYIVARSFPNYQNPPPPPKKEEEEDMRMRSPIKVRIIL